MPSALAVLRLMTNSNLVDCTTGKSPGFSPLRIPSGIDAGLTIGLAEVGAVAHQAACQRVFTLLVDRGNSVPRRQSDDFVALAVEERIATDQHCSGPQLRRGCKSGIDFTLIAR